ncbi:MAG: hypothetical protein AABO57_26205 [Acidobacteriota bacterium]
MPFGPGFDDRYRRVYAPAIRDAGLQPLRADSLSKPSPIMEDVWRLTKLAGVLLADLTGCNVNVFYELGLAHGIQKPVVLITDNVQEIPFDLRSLRVLVTRDMQNAEMRRQLTRALQETVADPSGALPAAFVLPNRGLEIAYTLGGRLIESDELDLIKNALNEVQDKDVKRITANIWKSLTEKQKNHLFSHLFWQRELETYAPTELVESVKERLAKLGEKFPLSLLAETIYSVRTGKDAVAVTLLVETGFARNFVEANIIYDLVEWAVHEKDTIQHRVSDHT